MTDQTMPAEGQEDPQEPLAVPAGTDAPPELVEGSQSYPDVFSREYVVALRQEAAEARVRAKRTDDLAARLILEIASGTGRLADPTDFPVNAELIPEFLGEDGLPDRTLIHEAVARLLAAKPHLAKPVFGDVGQGSFAGITEGPGLGSMLRQAAG